MSIMQTGAAEVDANGWPGTETLAKFDELLAQYE
jgi:hypothetical protein